MVKIHALVLCLTFAVVPAMAEPAPELRVMSMNVRYGTADDGENRWELRRDLLFDVLRNERPDVVGLQEALRFQLDETLDHLPGYSEIGEGRDGGKDGEYSAILYRRDRFELISSDTFWLSDTPGVPSAHWGNRIVRICTWGLFADQSSGDFFYVFNTHLDHESQASRERSVRFLAERVVERDLPVPFVLLGDWNAGEENPAMRFLYDETGLRDAYRVVHPEDREVGTFHGFTGRRDGKKIDAVLVPPAVDVTDAAIVRTKRGGRYPSDHFPVTASLRLGFRILVFSKTSGYRHESIPDGIEALRAIGRRAGFQVDASEDAAVFLDAQLARYRVVVFLSTSEDVLDEPQQEAFVRYVRRGGGFVGVHAASDTEYDWPWYGRLVGAYFSDHPEIQTARVSVVSSHPAVRGLPELWERRDEWYNFKALPEAVEVLARVDESSYTGGKHGADHPIAWSHEYDGGRSFYTAMGHTRESYGEPLFRRLLLGGILYAGTRN